MNPIPYQPAAPPPPWPPMVPPNPPMTSTFWETSNVRERLKNLQDTLRLAKAMQKELEMVMLIKDGKRAEDDDGASVSEFSEFLKERRINLESQVSLSVEAANALMAKLRVELAPFRAITHEICPWEEKSAALRLSNKIRKCKRNKRWRKGKRKRIAEMSAKERERFEEADREADEWRAREIAKDIAKRKMEDMGKIAKLKAKEERKRLESELETVLIVEKLKELRSIRIEKLKKQGHFLPEEDDKFLERVRAAVEEEEQQVIMAADMDAAKDAIATVEQSRKTTENFRPDSKDQSSDRGESRESKDQTTPITNAVPSSAVTNKEPGKQVSQGEGYSGAYDAVANLPIEFYHYYHGSNTDMGTLIEVRRTWDAYIRPGGSRIPGHWVEPPPPADDIWASYLVQSK
ncbi:U11/U12 small nuclear ribonucleoprotein 59 kDa protein [Prunus yedoensis var. nudiflora]|uniref:U11/U12 small nuclear ribonucleoprotein 59 kDa protein n=1 Tax=Prunus yedoensis var. nudiflora TaxID=2094558 RepID=A0A314UQP0_PRUYE|nr:U11/U12 small nuclear ribonucleoprotein 59 kDa protein [Prunus yedoensis var. nudiflora]